jgi:hypothetical protein
MTPTEFWALRVLIAYACHDRHITHQDHKALQATAARMRLHA